jgi:hypothetical protein
MPGQDVLLTGTSDSFNGEELSTVPPQKPEANVGVRDSAMYFKEIFAN